MKLNKLTQNFEQIIKKTIEQENKLIDKIFKIKIKIKPLSKEKIKHIIDYHLNIINPDKKELK